MHNDGDPELLFLERFAIAGVAADLAKTAVAPFKLLKFKNDFYQEPYIALIKKTIKLEGYESFWKGNVLKYMRYMGVAFGTKNPIIAELNLDASDHIVIQFFKNISSGGMAGAMSLGAVYQLDYIKSRMEHYNKLFRLRDGQRQIQQVSDLYKRILQLDGLPEFYAGFGISCARAVVHRGLYFGLYDTLKPAYLGPDPTFAKSFALGYGVSVISGFIAYPFETVRREMLYTIGEPPKYVRPIDCAVDMLVKEGPKFFIRGASVNIFRGVAGAGVLELYDQIEGNYIRFLN